MLNNLLLQIGDMTEIYIKSKKTKIKSFPSKGDIIGFVKHISNNLSHFEPDISTSLTPPFLLSLVTDIDLFKQRFQYQCTCIRTGGWTYYKSIKGGKRDSQCICKV